MAHEWGWQIVESGLIATGCSLAARWFNFAGIIVTNEVVGPLLVRFWVIPVHPDDPYVAEDILDLGRDSMPFPYQQNVNPDMPM